MVMFKFLNAVRSHLSVKEIEHYRLGVMVNDSESLENFTEFAEEDEILYPPLEALRFAIMYSHLEYARFLLQSYGGAVLQKNLCCPLLLLAVRLNDEPMVILICQYSAKVSEKTGINYLNSQGCELMESGKTALHTAAELGFVGCTRILLQYGADSSFKDCEGLTPLNRALQKFKPSYNVFLCVLELIKCERQLSTDVLQKVQSLHDIHHAKYKCDQCHRIPTGQCPTPLIRLCRNSLLEHLGPRLSLSFPKLCLLLPSPVLRYINLECDD
ncbi:hypothetical protein LOTGIDRAFT_231635 [Lottia gigantea]|uniref:SOCS box domain-containing protein n=1 Tax=Lottia gigantea TaxID=225164 RepID=V4A0Z1_LOTGI|nr:hypothetical protein LOTGIDRAFT_231635 [Lottia gigantea]ESO97483.1 hypothetical protein LOTGIDRAFT_231635 [Lottia gigantea]